MSRSAWRLERVGETVLVRCTALADLPGVAHAFSTRIGEDGAARFLAAAGIEGDRPAILRQVHGDRVIRAAAWSHGDAADGAVWMADDPPSAIPTVRFADCVPILLADRSGRGAAAIHAGWRGTAAEVAARAVEELGRCGISPSGLVAALGPAILPCCYEVGADVAAAVTGAAHAIPTRLDLHAANARQLVRAGVPEGSIHRAPWCTKCRGDLFFSHRREGEGAGRMMASVGPARARPSPEP